MKNIKLLFPQSLDEAIALLAEYGDEAKVIAGGTALTIMLKHNLVDPSVLVSLQDLDELRGFAHAVPANAGSGSTGGELRFGALRTIRFGETSPVVRAANPVLAETFGKVASVRVRCAATIGGNMTEADYASDPPGVLVAMGARVKAVGPDGEREIPLGEFFEDFYTTSLAEGEILTEVIVPDPAATSAATYLKFSSRSSEDRPCVGVSAVVDLAEDGTCRDLSVVVSAVSEVPVKLAAVEELARGHALDAGLIGEVAAGYCDGIEPLSDLRGSAWYRKQVVRALVRRAIEGSLAKCQTAASAS
ncbi:MAG TPA: FAD binding domain-containing protein [Trebonia sp.]|nr:FAD binding domain-containing protein [Trebonia sp.]